MINVYLLLYIRTDMVCADLLVAATLGFSSLFLAFLVTCLLAFSSSFLAFSSSLLALAVTCFLAVSSGFLAVLSRNILHILL